MSNPGDAEPAGSERIAIDADQCVLFDYFLEKTKAAASPAG